MLVGMNSSFDFILVGAGSAGCVLADRLTEDGRSRVLLLEAGGPDAAKEVRIPAAFSKLFKGPCDWAYETEPEPGLKGRRLYWPRGRLLGGSSSMNAMMYARGNPADYDEWAAAGNAGWGYDDLLPLFKRSEGSQDFTGHYHGSNGPLAVSKLRTVNPISVAFLKAAQEIGLQLNPDYNGATQEGAALTQVNQRQGRRCSAADAFLKPAQRRPNLTVLTAARADRLLLEGKRAVGVAYSHQGAPQQARATREVVLCGGAINSPQLLMLSGVGPAGHLQALGLPVVADLPGVGQNLQDHLAISSVYHCTQPVTLAAAESLVNLFKYLCFGTGMLTSNVGEALAFVRTRPDLAAPDIELIFAPSFYVRHGFDNPPGHGFTVGSVLLRPRSRGSLELTGTDAAAAPRLRANYLTDDEDARTLLRGLKLTRRVVQTRAFDAYRGAEVLPGEGVQSDDELLDYIRAKSETLYHPVGTCKMGSDPLAVVDAQLRVHGVAGLRVADASIMPTLPRGHTHAPTVAIGEKAADLIRAENRGD